MDEPKWIPEDSHSYHWNELQKMAENDPELARKLEIAGKVTDRYREAFQRLADS
jgi:hypothetical protein